LGEFGKNPKNNHDKKAQILLSHKNYCTLLLLS